MDNLGYSFCTFNNYAPQGISSALSSINEIKNTPVILCIGSDLVLGDSLGPLIGTLLVKKKINAYVYGTLSSPITAKEVNYAKDYLKFTHPNSTIIAIDAAVGNLEDIGVVRVLKKGIKPGLGVNKNLKTVGDISIIGIVAEKSQNNYKLLNATRLNLIYSMAEDVANGIETYLNLHNLKPKRAKKVI